MYMWFRRSSLVTAFLGLLVAGCASVDDDPTKNWSPQRFYAEAKSEMSQGDFTAAIKHFEALEARYPYGRYAQQAQLEVAYAYYKDKQPELAIAAAERFIRLHPTHPHVDYAYYLKGLINFKEHSNWVARLLRQESGPADHDPRAARQAYRDFKELVERFPRSRYVQDAAQRMRFLFDTMARYEVNVARFYYERKAYVAAVNRSKYVLENFQRAPAVEHALGIQALAYGKMGMERLMIDSYRVLKKNFPESPYLKQIPLPENALEKTGDPAFEQ